VSLYFTPVETVVLASQLDRHPLVQSVDKEIRYNTMYKNPLFTDFMML
jgi:hypothetical protein